MPERQSHQQRVKQLLAQDREINEIQMKEFHMQLDQALELSEAKAKQTRRRILIALAVYITGMIFCQIFVMFWHDAAPNATAGMIRGLIYLPFLISGLAAGIVGIWLVARYIFVLAPQLNRTRFDVQTSILLELQQQVKRLSDCMERQEK
jgi:hypothetical protein